MDHDLNIFKSRGLDSSKSKNDLFDVFRDSKHFEASVSENTKAAIKSDYHFYISRGGVFPALPNDLARFLEDNADARNPRSLRRLLYSLSQLHIESGLEDHTKDPAISKIMKGIFRLHGVPVIKSEYMRLEYLDRLNQLFDSEGDSITAIRDKAIIFLGFYGAFRRSEIASLRWDQLDTSRNEGITIHLNRSKADQIGQGKRVNVPARLADHDPINPLLLWRQCLGKKTGDYDGYIFRPLSPKKSIMKDQMTGHLVNEIVKRRVLEAECPLAKDITAHSLRSGFATEAYNLGASLAQIMEHGRWKDIKTVMGYIQVGRMFSDSALNVF